MVMIARRKRRMMTVRATTVKKDEDEKDGKIKSELNLQATLFSLVVQTF